MAWCSQGLLVSCLYLPSCQSQCTHHYLFTHTNTHTYIRAASKFPANLQIRLQRHDLRSGSQATHPCLGRPHPIRRQGHAMPRLQCRIFTAELRSSTRVRHILCKRRPCASRRARTSSGVYQRVTSLHNFLVKSPQLKIRILYFFLGHLSKGHSFLINQLLDRPVVGPTICWTPDREAQLHRHWNDDKREKTCNSGCQLQFHLRV